MTRSANDEPASFTCPVCDKVSYHPEDIRQGYCSFCHDWTGDQHYQQAKAELRGWADRARKAQAAVDEIIARHGGTNR